MDCEASASPGSSSGCLESLMFSKYPSAPAAPAEHGGLERIACREQDKTNRERERLKENQSPASKSQLSLMKL